MKKQTIVIAYGGASNCDLEREVLQPTGAEILPASQASFCLPSSMNWNCRGPRRTVRFVLRCVSVARWHLLPCGKITATRIRFVTLLSVRTLACSTRGTLR